MKRFYTVFICLLAMMLGGCVISPRRTLGGGGTGSGGSGGTGATGGQLYVTTPTSILRFSNAETINGNIAPDATITSSAFSVLQRLIVDTTNNRLYVVSQGNKEILIFDNASTLSGSVTPTRAIVGGNTGLNIPLDLALDTNNDLLYVADGAVVFVYASASTINGNVAPAVATPMNFVDTVGAIFLDVADNVLYEADTSGQTINQVGSPNVQIGNPQTTAQIAGPDTKLSQPSGLALDRSGRLFVSNSAAPVSITSYQNASTASGDTIPVGTISGSATLLQTPQQMLINNNITNDELYVVDPAAGSILIYTNVVTTQGDLAPARTISGSSTGLVVNGVRGLALDTTR